MEILLFLLALVVLATPVIAILAFSGFRRLEASLGSPPLQSVLNRIYGLEQRLDSLERALARGTQESPRGATAPTEIPHKEAEAPVVVHPAATPSSGLQQPAISARPVQPTPSPTIFAAPPLHVSRSESSASLDLETQIGGRWLNRIGIVALIAAVSFFLKYAFDNNWIGPRGRVGIGILLGAAMLPWSHWLLQRGYRYFSEGIAGFGAAVLYLSIWAGWHYYALFSQGVAFGAMIVVTAVMGAVALGRNSERIAVLSLLGGFLTPAIVSTGKDQQVVLFSYLLMLGVGLLVVAARRDWRSLAPLAFLLTQVYFWSWYESFYAAGKLERTLVFATLFFVLYAALPVLRAIRLTRLTEMDCFFVLLNAFAYLGALYTMLWPQNRWPLTLFVLALSTAHVVVARMIPAAKSGEVAITRLIFAGLALTFATLAIPIRLEGKWMTMAFAVEGAVLIWTGFRGARLLLRQAGYFLLVVAAFRVLVFPPFAPRFLWNERFATYLALIACFAVVLLVARQYLGSMGEGEKYGLGMLAVAANIYALIALSLEFWEYFWRNRTQGIDASLAQHLALSILWTSYATVLMVAGVKRSSSLLRWQALALFGLVVTKVFVYDSSYLERFYRIVSFLILGLVLLVVSFFYQRKVARERAAT